MTARDWPTILTSSAGLTDAEIARREGVTRATVGYHRRRTGIPASLPPPPPRVRVRFSGFARDLLDELSRYADDEKTTLVDVVQRFCRAGLEPPDETQPMPLATGVGEIDRLREALADIARGDYSDPLCQRTPEQRARDALTPPADTL